jgi:phage shock protein A
MSWSKVFTAFKGAVSETGETIADHQAIRIMDQELREAANEINAAKIQLTNIMAKRKGILRKVDELGKKLPNTKGMPATPYKKTTRA